MCESGTKEAASVGGLIHFKPSVQCRLLACAVTRRRFLVGASPTRQPAPAGSNRERPRHGCAAEKSNEIAPPHARPQAQETALYRLKLDLWKRLGVPSRTSLNARPDIRKGSFAIAV